MALFPSFGPLPPTLGWAKRMLWELLTILVSVWLITDLDMRHEQELGPVRILLLIVGSIFAAMATLAKAGEEVDLIWHENGDLSILQCGRAITRQPASQIAVYDSPPHSVAGKLLVATIDGQDHVFRPTYAASRSLKASPLLADEALIVRSGARWHTLTHVMIGVWIGVMMLLSSQWFVQWMGWLMVAIMIAGVIFRWPRRRHQAAPFIASPE